jgi:hypothetical protein
VSDAHLCVTKLSEKQNEKQDAFHGLNLG